MDFKNVPNKYRPIPFWSWNEKLDLDETKRQIKVMDEAGIGGFFMHARGGLQTEYMSDEWFENVSASIDEAKKRGMGAWAYDENGWPSGFGDSKITSMGIEYQQKYLRMEDTFEHKDTHISKCGEHYFYYDVNPFYVDVLDKKVIAEFIKSTYQVYYEKYGDEIAGFFTDEPQISRKGIPWSFVFEQEYKDRYNDDITEHLEELFINIGDYKDTRIKFWKMVTDLFSSSFFKQIYDWCSERGLKFTGHLVSEESLYSQTTSNGACMPHYEYFHIPGMDHLGRNVNERLTIRQVGSVAEQMGYDAVLSESFALCGHNVSFSELKGILEWQMVGGINLLCQHLEGYSLRGMRKRDYPPAMYYQQPWWSEYKKFNDAISREGMLLSKGLKSANVLLLHPQTTAWSMYNDNPENKDIDELNDKFLSAKKILEGKHISFHFGDETIIERHARVENGKLIIGKQSYDIVIKEFCSELLPTTKTILEEYEKSGGKFSTVDELPSIDVVDREDITYTFRKFDEFSLHFFVNSSDERKNATINVDGKKLNIISGEIEEFNKNYSFEPWGSLMVIEDGTKALKEEDDSSIVELEGEFTLADGLQNCMTLDKCDYYFDGELQERNGYVLNICERANALEREVKIHQDFYVDIDSLPNELYLVCETPEKFAITINGVPFTEKFNGYFRDKAFEKANIINYIKLGKNTISFDCDFIQSEALYENIKKAFQFESEKNKLVYDTEIEAIYLLGDFSVRCDGTWTELERNGMRYKGSFAIDKIPTAINLKDIEMQGFPFFCGEMTIEQEIDIPYDNPVLNLNLTGVNATKIEIDGFDATVIFDDRVKLNVSKGKHKIKLTLINNLRNLLGPFHMETGESYSVTPAGFFKEYCIWSTWGDRKWNNDYCFVRFGKK